MEVGFIAKCGGFQMKYGFVLGSRSGVYRVKREYGVVTAADREEEPVEFEIRGGEVRKPRVLAGEKLETSELALPLLRRILFFHPLESGKKVDVPTRIYRDVTRVLRFLSGMRFYRLFPDDLRDPRKPMDSRVLYENGSNLSSVLRRMEMDKRKALYLEEIKSALGRVVPGLTDLQVRQSGGYIVVKLRHSAADGGVAGSTFDLSQESDGTVRLLGLLTALYQAPPPSLLGLEEPELTIHPGALGVLADVMVEAASRMQIVTTTHSPDLIDRLPIKSLRAVLVEDGCTKVGLVSDTQADAVLTGLFSLGELHSMEGLKPSP